jgi:hypothetical protein
MARKLIAVAVLATFASCGGSGYEPEPDRRSDPLSSGARGTVEPALEELGFSCEAGANLDSEERALRETAIKPARTLIRVARKRPHGVYLPRGVGAQDAWVDQAPFVGDTMIQVLERAAHEFSDCHVSARMRAAAQELRTRR